MERVYRLTHDCYVSKGYALAQPDGMLVHYADFDFIEETSVFVAMEHGKVLGSISITMDGPKGLTVDKDFKGMCDELRHEGRRLAAVWRLVVHHSNQASRRVVMALIKAVSTEAVSHGYDSCLFVVNPRHSFIYQRLLSMKAIAEKGNTDGLANAPAVLLRGDRETLRAHPRSPIAQLPAFNAA